MPKNGCQQVAKKVVMSRGEDPCCGGSKRGSEASRNIFVHGEVVVSGYVPMRYTCTGEYGGGMWPRIKSS